MRFRFALQRLLHLREQHEQAMARDLVHARAAADEEHRVEMSLRATREHAQLRMSREATSVPIGTLQMMRAACDHLDVTVEAAQERTRAAEIVVDEKHQALTLAAQARRMLDRLKTRREEAFGEERNNLDRRTMDSVALSQYVRGDRLVTPARQRTGT